MLPQFKNQNHSHVRQEHVCVQCRQELTKKHISLNLVGYSGVKDRVMGSKWLHTAKIYGLLELCSHECMTKFFWENDNQFIRAEAIRQKNSYARQSHIPTTQTRPPTSNKPEAPDEEYLEEEEE